MKIIFKTAIKVFKKNDINNILLLEFESRETIMNNNNIKVNKALDVINGEHKIITDKIIKLVDIKNLLFIIFYIFCKNKNKSSFSDKRLSEFFHY